MSSSKRKRQSMDSAIADMSSGDSCVADSDTQPSSEEASSLTGSIFQNHEESPSKKCKKGWSFDIRDFGTAASQRPRRGTIQKLIEEATMRSLAQDSRDNATTTPPTITPQVTPNQGSEYRVKGKKEKPTQTPQRKQAPTALPTPPQSVEGTKVSSHIQVSPRRSTRERQPTERPQQASNEQDTLCKTKRRTGVVDTTSDHSRIKPPTNARKSRIVRLRVRTPSIHPGASQMSFTGSFSYRHKGSDEQESQVAQEETSFAEICTLQDYPLETFAQPRPEPILADSQDLYSSQSGPQNFGVASQTAVHVREHARATGEKHEQLCASISFHHDPATGLRPEEAQQQQCQPGGAMEHGHRENSNNSWQTQATVPWSPPKNPPSPAPTQDEPAEISFHASQATTIDEMPMEIPSSQTLSKEELHEIVSKLLAHRTYGPPKPEPVGQPSVWADARMDLCETLPYFRSYQGACHSTGGFVRGFMFDKVAHPRDYIDSNVIIARAGGGQVKDKETGELKASGDQVEGTTSQNLRNCMSHYNPVVIIAGTDNPHMPSQPPKQYCVLDHFKPTHIWAEKSGKGKIVRYRFEKLNARKDSWWRAKHVPDTVQLGSLPPPLVKACGTCAKESLQIYLNGWMCLSPSCPSFWLILPSRADSQHTQPHEPDEASLIYDPRFLKTHTPWPNETHSYPLKPPLASLSPHAVPGENTSEAFIRGVVCPNCNRCVPRLTWQGWSCPCSWSHSPPHALVPALSIRSPLWPPTTAYPPSQDTHSPLVGIHVSFAHGYRINRYSIPGIKGSITHMIANATVVEEPGGPDEMFEELQGIDIGLARRPIEGGMLKGGMWTRHFAVNYGMPYKFIAATESHPFPASTEHPVCRARSRLTWAAKKCLEDAASSSSTSTSPINPADRATFTTNPFNEILALCYFESQRISYHDDGETGLGPTIATLSLGSPGTMRVRLKSKHHHGVSSAGVYTHAPPMPGCTAYAARLALYDELAALKRASPAEYRARLKSVPRELGLRAVGNARDVLTLRLGHGDVVVMHGEGLQGYYEHAVEHAGKLRYALTSRYIDPGSVEGGGVVVGEDEGGYDGTLLGE